MNIACLHTHPSNIAVFDAAAAALGIPATSLEHTVREDLLADLERHGSLTAALRQRTEAALAALAEHAQVVLLTCSSLGPVVEAMPRCAVAVIRADAALAQAAVQSGERVTVLCAAPTTLQATRQLFEKAAQPAGVHVEVRLVEGAWALFKAGDRDGYFALLQAAVTQARGQEPTMVALAQASMAGAVALFTPADRPLTSPMAGLRAAVALTRQPTTL